MRKVLSVLIVLLVFANVSYGQFQVLEDSLVKDSNYNEFSGDTIISYLDFSGTMHDLPGPKDKNGDRPEVVEYKLNSYENFIQLFENSFSEEEIAELINSKCIVRFIALSSGEIVSVSFYFRNKEPEICMEKFVGLSRVIKKEFTLEKEFNSIIVTEGYVSSSINVAGELSRREVKSSTYGK